METEKLKMSTAEAPAPRARRAARLGTAFTPQERQALAALRDRYQQGRDQFSHCELARLRFLRWLYQDGQIAS